MSKKISKKVFSVILSLVIVFCCMSPSLAAGKSCSCGKSPLLVISGFSQYQLIDTSTGKGVWAPDADSIAKAVEKALPSLTTLLSSGRTQADYDKFCDEFLPIANELLGPIACTPDGEPKNSDVAIIDQFTGPVSDYDYTHVKEVFNNDIVDIACDAVGKDHVWVYGLDWRVDPLILADEIHEYVENIKKTSGHDKVSISGISMGGVIMASYLSKYGYEDLSNITMLSSAYTGLEMVGKLFTGEIEVDPDGLYNIITESIGDDKISTVLSKTGIIEKILPILNELLKYDGDRVYSECLIPLFGYNTGFWAFVPDSCYTSAKRFMFDRMNEGTLEQREIFKNRIDDYHYNVQSKIGSILRQAKADGVCVSIVSHYNMQTSPVSTASYLMSDQVIETIHTSGFATVADYGKTLNITKKAPYVSYDKIIDASTAYLPDNTWFIKDMKHVEYSNNGANDNCEFFKWILTAPAGTDVYSNAKFPQFMIYDRNTHVLSPLSGADGDVNADGRISLFDAKLILRYVAELSTLDDKQAWAADMNCDGSVSIVDAKNILTYIAAH